MEWTDALIARLRALWAEGLPTAEIGRRLGVSKNAVVGKAHRLDLPARPSPIRRGAASPRIAKRASGPTLPPLPVSPELPARPVLHVLPERTAPRPAPARDAFGAQGRVIACCWPIGEPGKADFRFCSDASVPGKPYCAQHAGLAYVKVRDRREDAA